MTARNPLVIISGAVKELPSGDTVNGASGGSVPIFPVRWFDQSDDDSTPPTGIPDLTADGVTLVDGDHVAGNHGVWAVHSGTWTSVHTWDVGDLILVVADEWSDSDNTMSGGAWVVCENGIGPLLVGTLNNLADVVVPAAVATALGAASIDALLDVDTTTVAPATGSLMFFNGGAWVPVANGDPPSDGDTARWAADAGAYVFGP